MMMPTVEAIVDERGFVHLRERVDLPEVHRALMTILEEPAAHAQETALLGDAALAEDRERPEVDDAWSHLQQGRQSSYRSRSRISRGPSCVQRSY